MKKRILSLAMVLALVLAVAVPMVVFAEDTNVTGNPTASIIDITVPASKPITLTPGTLSLDVSADRSVLYIHAMYIHDVGRFKKEIKQGLERRLLEVLR